MSKETSNLLDCDYTYPTNRDIGKPTIAITTIDVKQDGSVEYECKKCKVIENTSINSRYFKKRLCKDCFSKIVISVD